MEIYIKSFSSSSPKKKENSRKKKILKNFHLIIHWKKHSRVCVEQILPPRLGVRRERKFVRRRGCGGLQQHTTVCQLVRKVSEEENDKNKEHGTNDDIASHRCLEITLLLYYKKRKFKSETREYEYRVPHYEESVKWLDRLELGVWRGGVVWEAKVSWKVRIPPHQHTAMMLMMTRDWKCAVKVESVKRIGGKWRHNAENL